MFLTLKKVFYSYFHSKDVTKPRNKTKEFLFNLVFFLILPFLLLLKLGKKITKRCKKDHDSKKETKTQDESQGDDDKKGPEVEILKDGDVFNDDRLRANSDLSSQHPDDKRGSKGIMPGIKRRHSGTIGNDDDIASSGTPHGSKHKMAAPGSRRSSEETARAPSISSRGTGSQDKVQVTTSSHNYININVDQSTEPPPPQVGNVFISIFL